VLYLKKASSLKIWKKQLISAQNGVYEGPGLLGLWKIDRANVKQRTQDQIKDAGDGATYTSNELVMLTDESVPFTDKLGYRHMGAFPYGANLVITKDGKMRDTTNFIDVKDQEVSSILNSSGIREATSYGVSSEANNDIQNSVASNPTINTEQEEVTIQKSKEKMDNIYSTLDDVKQQQNSQSNPYFYENMNNKTGIAAINNVDNATKILMDVPISTVDESLIEDNQKYSTYSG
jgi:hypothetical protein